ncbi:TIM barrel protein [Microlunatus panaciterrae]|uniref:Xylose isomerase n=1 Tax=Microlunatus panaciterrae TaxID=400768 RepID=A0ABS2RIA5_9ACTN|nr:TIM barrel protein [Microlunatus panaciterrae]MBM7798692.1 xylose isomerase [Microlunatus panaciterrae]
MSELPVFGAGIWHFATYKDRYATDGYGPEVGLLEQIDRAGAVGDLSVVDLNYPFVGFDGTLAEVNAALARNGLRAIAITPEIYTRTFMKGSFTNPDPRIRQQALELMHEATAVAKQLGCDYVKLWTGQDGWDYPFQVNHHDLWNLALDGLKELVSAHPEINFVIEYKPREPRVKIIFPSAARTLLGIEKIGLPNLGILLDFGHSLYGLESPADAAQLAIDYGRLFAIDVNDNMRGWDDDMVVGSVHLVETFEFFHTLRRNGWQGVWQLDQFPFREDSVEAARLAIRFLKAIHRALDVIDDDALAEAQSRHDALAAHRLVQDALLTSMAGLESPR